jgi:transposase
MGITTIGLDLAKKVYQVHAINGAGEVVVRKALRRVQLLRFFEQLDPCLVGIEACGTSHYWAREISKFGHQVRLMPPAYVKPYVKRGSTEAGHKTAPDPTPSTKSTLAMREPMVWTPPSV